MDEFLVHIGLLQRSVEVTWWLWCRLLSTQAVSSVHSGQKWALPWLARSVPDTEVDLTTKHTITLVADLAVSLYWQDPGESLTFEPQLVVWGGGAACPSQMNVSLITEQDYDEILCWWMKYQLRNLKLLVEVPTTQIKLAPITAARFHHNIRKSLETNYTV